MKRGTLAKGRSMAACVMVWQARVERTVTRRRAALALAVVTAMVCASAAHADLVPQTIAIDTTWNRAGNPWMVMGNVTVRSGATLTVEAGAVVEFFGNYRLENDSTTSGMIVVQGAPYDSVYFGTGGTAAQWAGIRVNITPGSSFDYAVVLDAKIGLELNTVDTPITHCAFRRAQSGIKCKYASPAITSSWVSETTFAGILCESLLETPNVSRPVISDCNLFDNAGYNILLNGYTGGGVTTINAQYNWWGTSSVPEIEASIYDTNDPPYSCNGIVDYAYYRTQTPVEERTWGSIKALFRD